MKRILLLVILLVVVGAFAGFQQYSSWSLNRSQNNPEVKPQEGASQSSPSPSRAKNQGRGGAAGGLGGTRLHVLDHRRSLRLGDLRERCQIGRSQVRHGRPLTSLLVGLLGRPAGRLLLRRGSLHGLPLRAHLTVVRHAHRDAVQVPVARHDQATASTTLAKASVSAMPQP